MATQFATSSTTKFVTDPVTGKTLILCEKGGNCEWYHTLKFHLQGTCKWVGIRGGCTRMLPPDQWVDSMSGILKHDEMCYHAVQDQPEQQAQVPYNAYAQAPYLIQQHGVPNQLMYNDIGKLPMITPQVTMTPQASIIPPPRPVRITTPPEAQNYYAPKRSGKTPEQYGGYIPPHERNRKVSIEDREAANRIPGRARTPNRDEKVKARTPKEEKPKTPTSVAPKQCAYFGDHLVPDLGIICKGIRCPNMTEGGKEYELCNECFRSQRGQKWLETYRPETFKLLAKAQFKREKSAKKKSKSPGESSESSEAENNSLPSDQHKDMAEAASDNDEVKEAIKPADNVIVAPDVNIAKENN